MEAKFIEAKLMDMAVRTQSILDTIAFWQKKITSSKINEPDITKFITSLQFCYEASDMCIKNQANMAKEKIQFASEEIATWCKVSIIENIFERKSHSISAILSRNDMWAMYLGLEASTEVIAEWEYSLISTRARAHEEDDVIFGFEEECLLNRLRAILACYETAIACWQNRASIAQQRAMVAKYEIGSWQQLEDLDNT